ncbi:single-stranded DNA-binding protein [Actinomyces viscosus]|uniref:Helix-destabilizing protein n=1 Tax=Actinomyces viscosus TaxID=1656 RepID=A0A3S4Z6W0_ACTVI|nr:single-stranded DNA-binding protein [Actinomyces viscosus]TFH52039.1 single-stranded DNA-binding protein [Actinomyces viscosus]VEI14420.1 Helix-destabilizing protein [Actinomyces viscosus]
MTRQLDLTVQGVVGTNPVLSRVGDNARPYCRFRVAVTPTYRTDQGWNNADTIWFTAKAWGQLAANLSHSVRKGDAVLLTGRFSQESWESNGREHETNVITLQAAGHDLTRGESRFARVRAVESAPSASSGAGAGDTEVDSGDGYHVSPDHWDTAVPADGALAPTSQDAETPAGSSESGAPSQSPESPVIGPVSLETGGGWPAYELADDLVEEAAEVS